jgi:hypothetical protein
VQRGAPPQMGDEMLDAKTEDVIFRLVELIDCHKHRAKPWKSYKRERAKASMRILRTKRTAGEVCHAA